MERCRWEGQNFQTLKEVHRLEEEEVTYSEFLSVALVIQHAMRMRRIILSSVACSALPYLPHYLITGMIFGKSW